MSGRLRPEDLSQPSIYKQLCDDDRFAAILGDGNVDVMAATHAAADLIGSWRCASQSGSWVPYPAAIIDDVNSTISVLERFRDLVAADLTLIQAKVTMRPREKDEYEAHMTLEEFTNSVRCGVFIDYDGHGELATAEEVSDVVIMPSTARQVIAAHPWATHVVWYNK